MTIALGMLAKDGLVLAADSQETYPGSLKVTQGKILAAVVGPHSQPRATLGVTGAGSATHLDALNQSICDGFAREKPSSIEACQLAIADKVLQFNMQHVAPFGGWPEHERPCCSLVVGAAVNGKFGLWTTEKTVMREVHYGAVGIGSPYATLLLSRMWTGGHDGVRITALLAAYVMYAVKQSVEGCGKDTHIVFIEKGGQGVVLEPGRVRLLEEQFERYLLSEDAALHYVLGMRPRGHGGSIQSMSARLGQFRQNVARIFTEPFEGADHLADSPVGVWTPGGYPLRPKRSRRPPKRRA
jgi:hypothetical protein